MATHTQSRVYTQSLVKWQTSHYCLFDLRLQTMLENCLFASTALLMPTLIDDLVFATSVCHNNNNRHTNKHPSIYQLIVNAFT